MASLSELSAQLEKAIADLTAKSENFEQAMADEREAGRRDRDQEVADLITSKDQERVSFGESEYARGKTDGDSEGYTRGFADGVASVPPCPECPDVPPGDPDLQAKLDEAITRINELEAQMVEKDSQVVAMQGRISELEGLLATKDQEQADAVAKAVSDFKAQELEKIRAIEVDFQ